MMEQTNIDLLNDEMRNNIEKLLDAMSIKNYQMAVSPGSAHGDNYMGIIAKIVATGEDKNGKITTKYFIVKSAPKNEGFREFANVRTAFNREIYMYSKVFPIFTKLQEEKGILKPFKSFAKYYNSTMTDLNESLAMEDMKELGFSLCDRREPLDYNHVMLVMREYGKLHALSYALRDQEPEVFKELSENTEDEYVANADFSENAKKSFQESTEGVLKLLDHFTDKVAFNKFKQWQTRMFEDAAKLVRSESAGKYSVITHSDCWMNNILFAYKDALNPKLPTELCFLDWQLSRNASPALDLSYFIFTCTDKKLRDQHYDDMIQEYYNSLSSFLIELGSDPEEMLPFEALQEQLKKFCAYGLQMAIFVLRLMTSESEEIPNMHAAENWDGFADSFGFSSKNEEKYNERIRAVVLDFIKFGYDF